MANWTYKDLAKYQERRKDTHTTSGAAEASKPQRGIKDESLAKTARKAAYVGRVKVRVVCLRFKLADRDNLYEKDLLDGIKHAGIIFDDSPEFVEVETCQVKVDEKAQEQTLVEIIPL